MHSNVHKELKRYHFWWTCVSNVGSLQTLSCDRRSFMYNGHYISHPYYCSFPVVPWFVCGQQCKLEASWTVFINRKTLMCKKLKHNNYCQPAGVTSTRTAQDRFMTHGFAADVTGSLIFLWEMGWLSSPECPSTLKKTFYQYFNDMLQIVSKNLYGFNQFPLPMY